MKNTYKEYTREYAVDQVGSGWGPLVHKIYDKIATLDTPIEVVQVKEKWGGLRVYTHPYHQELDDYVTSICKESFTICEFCGNPGSLRKGSWYRTLCDEHSDGSESINPF